MLAVSVVVCGMCIAVVYGISYWRAEAANVESLVCYLLGFGQEKSEATMLVCFESER